MKKLISAVIMVIGVTFGFQVSAGEEHEAEGVITGVKAADKKITIKHGPIKSLGMDGMTMDFAVNDPGMLEDAKKGHKISFVIEVDKKGNFVIVDMEDKGMSKMSMTGGDGHNHKH